MPPGRSAPGPDGACRAAIAAFLFWGGRSGGVRQPEPEEDEVAPSWRAPQARTRPPGPRNGHIDPKASKMVMFELANRFYDKNYV